MQEYKSARMQEGEKVEKVEKAEFIALRNLLHCVIHCIAYVLHFICIALRNALYCNA